MTGPSSLTDSMPTQISVLRSNIVNDIDGNKEGAELTMVRMIMMTIMMMKTMVNLMVTLTVHWKHYWIWLPRST